MSLWKNTKFSWDKWNCRKVSFYRIVLILISRNLPFGCQYICRKTLQLIVYFLYLSENTGKANHLNISKSENLKNQKLLLLLESYYRWASLPYTFTHQSMPLSGGPFLTLTSLLVNKELSFQRWVLIKNDIP